MSFNDMNEELAVTEPSKFKKHGKKIANGLKAELEKMISSAGIAPETRLHAYQIEAVQAAARMFENGNGPYPEMALIVAPPGSGKSGMIALLPYVLESQKVLILTPSTVISTQLAADFGHPDKMAAFFNKAGLFQNPGSLKNLLEEVLLCNKQKDVNELVASQKDDIKVVIVNAQKFGGNARNSLAQVNDVTFQVSKKLDEFDTVIVDEAHKYPAQTWANIIDCFKGKKVVFLTATPFKGPAEKQVTLLSNGTMKLAYEIQNEQVEGITVRNRRFIEKATATENQSRSFSPAFIAQVKGDILALLEENKGREPRLENPQALVVVPKIEQAKNVAWAMGEQAILILSDKDRDNNIKAFSKGEKQIAVVCGVLKEGYDNPNVTLVAMLGNYRSSIKFEQFIGRCTRIHRNLTGPLKDRSIATVLSYTHFQLRKLWDLMIQRAWATTDPEEDSDSEEVLEIHASNSMDMDTY